MNYMFNGAVAKDVGISAAVLFHSISWWIAKNRANEKNFHDGRYWTYSSVTAFARLFPFFTEKMIRTSLNKLEKNGYIISGNYNKSHYDRTKWYALGEVGAEYAFAQNKKSICPSEKIDLPKKANQNCQKGEPIPDSITDIDTDIDPDQAEVPEVPMDIQKEFGQAFRPLLPQDLDRLGALMGDYGRLNLLKAIGKAKERQGKGLAPVRDPLSWLLKVLQTPEADAKPRAQPKKEEWVPPEWRTKDVREEMTYEEFKAKCRRLYGEEEYERMLKNGDI